jgi:hypothetical protein
MNLKNCSIKFLTFLWQLNFIVGQIHRASNKNSYQLKYDRYYPNASEQFTYFKPLSASENLTRMPSRKDLSDHNLNLEIFLNSTLNRISDLFFIKNRDFNLLFDGKLSVWLFSIFGTLLVGASGIMPVIIMPHLIKDHTKLGKYPLYFKLKKF